MRSPNLDESTVKGFGEQWSRFDQHAVAREELEDIFSLYFQEFPWEELPPEAVGFDLGCGSGRWARLVAPRVGRLYCFDAAEKAAAVARARLAECANAQVAVASAESLPVRDASMDFGYSLGVLHHVPDTLGGLEAAREKLKPGAPFLVYLYYAFDNRPWWFRLLWKVADAIRRVVSRMPYRARYLVSQIIASFVYFPVARTSRTLEACGLDVDWIPMSGYRYRSFYTMRTDALDRFGTRLVQRFTREEVHSLLEEAGFEDIRLSDAPPYWTAVAYRPERRAVTKGKAEVAPGRVGHAEAVG